ADGDVRAAVHTRHETVLGRDAVDLRCLGLHRGDHAFDHRPRAGQIVQVEAAADRVHQPLQRRRDLWIEPVMQCLHRYPLERLAACENDEPGILPFRAAATARARRSPLFSAGVNSRKLDGIGSSARRTAFSMALKRRREKTGLRRGPGGTGRWALAIHGGAGSARTDALDARREQAVREELSRVLVASARTLAAGGSSLDVVEAAVVELEDSPLFNAGRGAVFNAHGEHELEASIMEGRELRAGAVANV